MKLKNTTIRIALQNKILALILSMLLLLSVFSTGIPAAFAADDEGTPQATESPLGLEGSQGSLKDSLPSINDEKFSEYTGGRPDISELRGKKDDLSESQKKLSTRLLQLTDEKFLPPGLTKNKLIKQMKEQKQIKKAPITNGAGGDSLGLNVYLYIQIEDGYNFDMLSSYNVEDQDLDFGLAVVWVDLSLIEEIASLEGVRGVREVIQPYTKSGSVMTQGDSIHNVDLVRAQTGADGTGVKIGIISDGVDSMASAVSSGDLPGDVTVLRNAVGGDEGTAMLEIVYDLAPGAELYFHDCGNTVLQFNAAIEALAAAGCTVICDDIGWYGEPFFEDGIIAQHVQTLTNANNIVYVTAAGNDANKHYQGLYEDYGDGFADLSHGTGFPDLVTHVPAGSAVEIDFQWNDSFGSSGNNYNLYLFPIDENGYYQEIAWSVDVQNGNDDPQEYIFWVNDTGVDFDFAISVDGYLASQIKILELFVYCYGDAFLYPNNLTAVDSIFGHAAVPGAISCGAIDPPDPDTIADYSSHGPVTMISGTRQKPDISGVAGVSVTGAGGFPSTFYGTSAAAPHIAAIAAILQSRFPSMDAGEIKSLITDNGVDLGASGYDSIFGFGRSDALASALSYVFATFNAQGGSAVDTQLILKGGKVTEPTSPTRSGHDFAGWYKELAYTNSWNFAVDTVTTDTTIYAKWNVVYPVTGVSLNKSTSSLMVGGTDTLTATVAPSNATDKSVTWGSSSESVATVSNGVVTAIGSGVATITVTTVDGAFTDTCTVTVTPFYGEGTEASPYLITNTQKLNEVRNYPSAYYRMENDIEFAEADFEEGGAYYNGGAGWEPIGLDEEHTFSGSFDGNGYAISGLYQNLSGGYAVYGGLFGYISFGTIENLGMIGSDINVSDVSHIFVGGIVGRIDNGTIRNCYNTGSVSSSALSSSSAGGITAVMEENGTISECFNTGTVKSISDGNGGRAAGIAANAYIPNIDNCYNAGKIENTCSGSYVYTGGIVGDSYSGTIDDCYNTGEIVSNDLTNLGGIIGESDLSAVSSCYYLDYAPKGIGSGTDTTVAVTKAQLTQQATFVGFNFTTIWTMTGNATYAYPELQDVPMTGTYVTSITVTSESDTVGIGSTLQMSASVLPADADDKTVTWSVENGTGEASIDESGLLTGIAKGTVIVKAAANDISLSTGTKTIIITKPVTGVSLDKETMEVAIGDTGSLSETVAPSDAYNKTVTWSSGDEAVATVSGGVVTGVAKGNATITVTTVDGGFTDTCAVTITQPVTGVTLDKDTMDIFNGDTDTLNETVSPADASNNSVTWGSSNESVATVADGVVSAVGVGSATITVTTVDGGLTDTCAVTVVAKSDNDYLRGCSISFGDADNDFWNSVWGEYVDDKEIIAGSIIDLEMPNFFTQCELTPFTSDRDYASYKIYDGTTLLSDNVPYIVDVVSAGTVSLTVEVTAHNGDTRDYTVNITRNSVQDEAYPFNITFSSEHGGGAWFEPSFYKYRYTYDKTIENSVINAQAFVYPMDANATFEIYHNGTLLETDQSATIDFTVGTNRVEIVITADSSLQKTYTFLIHRRSASSVDLIDLTAQCVLSEYYSGGEFSGNCLDFHNDIIDYTLDLPNSANDIVFDLTLADSENASVVAKMGSTVLTYVEGTGYQVALDGGLNVFTFEVSHPSLGYTKTYTVNVSRDASSSTNADLCNLYEGGSQVEGFNSAVTLYQHYEKYGSSVNLVPVVADSAATYKVYKDGILVSDNTPPGYESLRSAPLLTVFTIEVTAANGVTTKIYTFTVSRVGDNAELSYLEFSSSNETSYLIALQDGVYTYAFDAANEDSTLGVYASNNANAEIVIYDGGTLLWQEGMGDMGDADFNLDVGLNTFTIEVTAENGIAQNTYTFNITRTPAPGANNANVSNFFLYVGGDSGSAEFGNTFSSDVLSYSYSVANPLNSAELYFVLESGFATSEVYLNGEMMALCGYELHSPVLNNLRINEGLNVLEIVVTAQDGSTTKTYTFNITRASSSLVSIQMISEPDKTEYLGGESIDLSGLSILANFSSGYMGMLDGDDVTVSGFDTNTSGPQTVTLVYQSKFVTYDVVVVVPVSGVSLDKSTSDVLVGATDTLTATVAPSGATNKSVTWGSSDESVATVSGGVVTGVADGDATITVTTVDGSFTDTCVVTVTTAVTGVSLDKSTSDLLVGETDTLTETVAPSDATDKSVTWGSSNVSVATVSGGVVTAVAKGTATITVTTTDGSFTDTCTVTVTKPVTGVSLDKSTSDLLVGETDTLTATVAPSDASDVSVTWDSSDESVATVSGGVVTAVAKGTATITVTTTDGSFTDTCAVIVTKPVTGVSLDKSSIDLPLGETETLTATVAPSDASDTSVTWSSSNESVATVSGGVVTGVAVGSATITVTTTDGSFTDTCAIWVVKPVTGVSLDKSTSDLLVGDTDTLTQTVSPSDATNKSVTWSSSDESVATVSGGVISALGGGEATITVTTVDGSFTDTCVVTVTRLADGVSLDYETLEIGIGSTETLTPTVSPADTSNKDVTWESSNTAVATVSDGEVTGVAEGVAVITVTTVDGGFEDSCTITVVESEIESSVYTVDRVNGLLKGVPIDTTVAAFKANFKNDAADLKVFAIDGSQHTGDHIGTGMTVKLVKGVTVYDELTIVVLGDINGDCAISIVDYTLVRLDILGLKELIGAAGSFEAAADVNGDGVISIVDYTLIRLDILGLKPIH